MSSEKRHFPRVEDVHSRQIVSFDDGSHPRQNLVLTNNLSGSGISFQTERDLSKGQLFLIYLNDVLLEDLKINRVNLLRSGDYYLCRVVWCQKLLEQGHEIGATFIQRQSCESSELETFLEFMNLCALESLPDLASEPGLETKL